MRDYNKQLNFTINGRDFTFSERVIIRFYDKKQTKVMSGFLDEPETFTIDGRDFTLGHRMKFDEDGNIIEASLLKKITVTTSIGEIECGVTKAHHQDMYFFSSGKIKRVVLAKAHEFSFDGHLLKVPSREKVHFYENGQMQMAKVSKGSTINLNGETLSVSGDTYVTFHENGEMQSVRLKDKVEFEVQGKNIYAKIFELSVEGRPVVCHLDTAAELKLSTGETGEFKRHDQLVFDKEGNVFGIYAKNSQKVRMNNKDIEVRYVFINYKNYKMREVESLGAYCINSFINIFPTKDQTPEEYYKYQLKLGLGLCVIFRTFFHYGDKYDDRHIKALMSTQHITYTYQEKDAVLEPFKWITFNEKGRLV